jgi:hypothetical protein
LALFVRFPDDWQHLAQLRALTSLQEVVFYCTPLAGVTLAVLDLHCDVSISGYDLGVVLLACPALQRAFIGIMEPALAMAQQPGSVKLWAHPTLQKFALFQYSYDHQAPYFASLAPVLAKVPVPNTGPWAERCMDHAGSGLPDLSCCTSATQLMFECMTDSGGGTCPRMEDYLQLLRPPVMLQRLKMYFVTGFTARGMLALQDMLPQLEHVYLSGCGKLVPGDLPLLICMTAAARIIWSQIRRCMADVICCGVD